jgi:hypothetical protein
VRPLHGGFEVEQLYATSRQLEDFGSMERPFRRVRLLSLILLSAVVASDAQAAAIEKKDQIQVAALALPGGPQADWQQWDSFLTNVVKKLGADFQPALRDQLGETFLDSRYQLV